MGDAVESDRDGDRASLRQGRTSRSGPSGLTDGGLRGRLTLAAATILVAGCTSLPFGGAEDAVSAPFDVEDAPDAFGTEAPSHELRDAADDDADLGPDAGAPSDEEDEPSVDRDEPDADPPVDDGETADDGDATQDDDATEADDQPTDDPVETASDATLTVDDGTYPVDEVTTCDLEGWPDEWSLVGSADTGRFELEFAIAEFDGTPQHTLNLHDAHGTGDDLLYSGIFEQHDGTWMILDGLGEVDGPATVFHDAPIETAAADQLPGGDVRGGARLTSRQQRPIDVTFSIQLASQTTPC